MAGENLTRTTLDQTSIEPSPSNNEDVQCHSDGMSKRRSLLGSIGIAGTALSVGVALTSESQAKSTRRSTGRLPKGNAVPLAAIVELIEADPVQAKEYERRLDLEQEIQAFEGWQQCAVARQ